MRKDNRTTSEGVIMMMFWRNLSLAAAVAVAVTMAGAGEAMKLPAGESAKADDPAAVKAGNQESKGPLATLPSAPGPHLEKIKALGDNQWLNLGKPAPDPKYGPAQGRSWSRKMAFAPDLRGAFIYGEGVHGGASVRGGKRFYNDDLFFYDINAHAWVCCHPGTSLDPPGPGLKLDEASGCETDKDGNLLPVAVSVHAYWAVDYDTDRKMFVFMPSPASLYWTRELGKFRSHFSTERADPKDPRWSGAHSPYYYDSKTGKFERRRATAPCAGANADNALFYSPRQKKAVYFFRGVWLYDHTVNAWKKACEEGGGNAAYCYDSKRDVVYVVRGSVVANEKGERGWYGANTLQTYDLADNKWTKPEIAEGDAGVGMESNQAFFTYDVANDVVVFHIHGKHRIYDPNARKWTVLPDTLPEPGKVAHWMSGSGFYDPELNAHFYFNASDSDYRPGNMWAYRYKRPPEKK